MQILPIFLPIFLAASSWLQASLSAVMAKWRRLAKQSRLAARLHCNAENIDNVLAGNDFPIVHTYPRIRSDGSTSCPTRETAIAVGQARQGGR
jgi:hypothetical protein